MRIVHNVSALNAWRVNKANNDGAAVTIRKLASGYRINAAADDAAGLAISEKMRAQIRGLDQAQRNVQDGLSLIQTAEGGIGSIQSALQRMRELCVQAANDTLNSDDRLCIQQEIDEIRASIGDIAGKTAFNGVRLLDGNLSANPHAVSASAAPALSIPGGGATVSANITVDGRAISFDFTAVAGSVEVTARYGAAVMDTQTVTSATAEPVIEWQRALGGSTDDSAASVFQTADGGYIVAGYTESNDGDVSGNHGDHDYWIVKLDADGSLAWQKTLGGSSYDAAYSIQQTADGGYIVGGITGSSDGDVSGNHGPGEAWAAKLDEHGDIQWQRALGSASNEMIFSIQQTADGGYIAVGAAEADGGDVTGTHGNSDIWVVKLDAGGNIDWQKALGGSSSDFGYSIRQTVDGGGSADGYILTGYTSSSDGDISSNNGTDDMWVVRLNLDGSIAWEQTLGGVNQEAGTAVEQTGDGGFIVSGVSSGGNMWVVKLDGGGNLAWQKILGGSATDAACSIQQTEDGGYIVAGMTQSTDGDVTGNHGGRDLWVVKLDGSGNLVWEKALGGSGEDVDQQFMAIRQSADGGFIVATGTQSVDGDVTGNHGGRDAWVVKLGPDMLAGSATLSLPGIADQNGTLQFDNVTVTLNAAMDTVTGIQINATAESAGLMIQAGANAGQSIRLTVDGMTPGALGLDGLPGVLSHGSAIASLSVVDGAINATSAARASLGAAFNALEHTAGNAANAAENLAGAESRIRDLDMAIEAAKMARMAILAQASQAMLSQANQQPQAVLQLLR